MSDKGFRWDDAEHYLNRARQRMRGYAKDAEEGWSKVRAGKMPKLGVAAGVAILGLGSLLYLSLFGGAIATLGMMTGLLAVFLGPPLWVFYDADRRGLGRPVLWALLALLAPLVGLVTYLLIRPETQTPIGCDGCGRKVRSDYVACPFCGTARRESRHTCPACNSEINSDWQFCPFCRKPLERGATEAAPGA